MSTVIMLATFAMLAAFGCYLHFYSRFTALFQDRHAANLQRQELEVAKQPVQAANEQLGKLIQAHELRMAGVETNLSDEKNAIKSLIEQEGTGLANIRSSIEKIGTGRRTLRQQIEEVRQEWSREEDLKLSNSAEHEQSLSRLREQVKQISHEIEREQKSSRVQEIALERDIARLERRVDELIDQKEISQTTLVSDGSITAARADLGFVIIDIGWEQNLRPGTRFQVFATRAGKSTVKGLVQVMRVEGRIAHARILEEKDVNDPIIVGDHLHNPIYDPKATKVFVIKGDFFRYSKAELARFIQEAGGEVENELTTRTNFLVAGENSDDWLRQASNYGVIILSENKLIEFIRMPTTAVGTTLDLASRK
jgi:NAD-dependent DNA ligase